MDKTINPEPLAKNGWLTKLHFLALGKCAKDQSNRQILSKVILYADEQMDRQTQEKT